ncbi:MaoC family dehydratase [Nocardioides sp. zg-ZUI104]|nr:MaoC family dehydratase [Nocardioides faecalis]
MAIRVEDLPEKAGAQLPSSGWLQVEQDRITDFADATDDHQWIHVNPERAQSGPYGTTVAHGFLTLSLVAPLLKQMLRVEGATSAFNYGLEKVRFPSPVTRGARIRGTGRIIAADVTEAGVRLRLGLSVEVEDQAKPACVLELIVLYSSSQRA